MSQVTPSRHCTSLCWKLGLEKPAYSSRCMVTTSARAESDNIKHLICIQFWRTLLLLWSLLLLIRVFGSIWKLPASSPSKPLMVFSDLAALSFAALSALLQERTWSSIRHERCTSKCCRLQNTFSCISRGRAKLAAEGPLDARLPAPLLPHAKGSRRYRTSHPGKGQRESKESKTAQA